MGKPIMVIEKVARIIRFTFGNKIVHHLYQGGALSFLIRWQKSQYMVAVQLAVLMFKNQGRYLFIKTNIRNEMMAGSRAGGATAGEDHLLHPIPGFDCMRLKKSYRQVRNFRN